MSKMYCCEKECFESPRAQVDGVACTRCNSYLFCRCRCVTWQLLKKDQEELKLKKDQGQRELEYCCEKKCFRSPRDQVDGLACRKCDSYAYCRCRCVTWQLWKKDQEELNLKDQKDQEEENENLKIVKDLKDNCNFNICTIA